MNLDQAKAELECKCTEGRDGKLPTAELRPKFDDFTTEYIGGTALAQKKPATRPKERLDLAKWTDQLRGVCVDKIPKRQGSTLAVGELN